MTERKHNRLMSYMFSAIHPSLSLSLALSLSLSLSLTGARSVRPVDRKPSFTAPTSVLYDKEDIGMIAKESKRRRGKVRSQPLG